MDTSYSSNNITNGTGSGTGTSTGNPAMPGSGARTSTAQSTGTSLRDQLSSLKADLDGLMSRASGLSDEELRKAHTRIMAQFSSMRYAARGMADEASRQLSRGVETTTEYVREKPMQSVAVAVGAGIVLGMLLRRP